MKNNISVQAQLPNPLSEQHRFLGKRLTITNITSVLSVLVAFNTGAYFTWGGITLLSTLAALYYTARYRQEHFYELREFQKDAMQDHRRFTEISGKATKHTNSVNINEKQYNINRVRF